MYYFEPCLIYKNENQFEKLLKTAKILGYNGTIAYVDFSKSIANKLSQIEEKIRQMGSKHKMNVFFGLLLKNHKQIRYIQKARRKVDSVAVIGGDIKTNRMVVESVYVDFLIDPQKNRKKDCGLNHVFAKAATKNDVSILINAKRLTSLPDHHLSREVTKLRELVRVLTNSKTMITISSCAEKPNELRDPIMLSSFLHILGLELKDAKKSISSIPLNIVKKNQEKRDEKWILPGVKVKKWGVTGK
ncbi:MAG: hypothetical protein J7K83_03680 [Candidatus Aenigmarchaeota archaeon]|nr:hypothetical protein [Candidatus Aenigmarchaeota archaeon]